MESHLEQVPGESTMISKQTAAWLALDTSLRQFAALWHDMLLVLM